MSLNKEEVERLIMEAEITLESLKKARVTYTEEVNNKKQVQLEKVTLAKYQIKVIGLAETEYKHIQELDGISCQDEFVEYLDASILKDKLITGYLEFKIIVNNLYSVTTYTSIEKLTDDELLELGTYTKGQWSDGIGEGFEQNPCRYGSNGEEVFISPWYYGQEIQVVQEEIKDSVPS
jgi:hypothetical protein